MPRFGPVKRKDLIKFLRQLGFEGPYAGRKHEVMVKGEIKLILPNPHQGDIGRILLAEMLREAHISRDEWERL
jgi:predicted RNA binding protein YcfA (HicA-like mRNA interferase family)